jgi:predicted transcriptional regulator
MVLISPRRYGKTNLISQIVTENSIPCSKIDLFMAVDDDSICKFITDAIERAINEVIPFNPKVSEKILKIFHAFDFLIKLSDKKYGLSFKQQRNVQQDVQNHITHVYESLKALSELAKLKQKIVVVFVDEFQEVAAGSSCNAIMGIIRNVAQESEFLSFIFSGSKRYQLNRLFNKKGNPLYMMCTPVILDRVRVKEYRSHLNSLSMKRWGQILEPNCFELIMRFTEAHVYYVNLLCSALWALDNVPTIDNVTNAWYICANHERSRIIDELNNLTHSQKDVLKGVALYPTDKPTSIEFTKNIKRPVSTINQSIKSLTEKDIICRIEDEDPELLYKKTGFYWILDPMIKHMIINSQTN